MAEGAEHPTLYRKEIELEGVSFLDNELITGSKLRIPVFARVRYRQPLTRALLTIHNSSFKLVFDSPVKFVAAGQSAVFYEDEGPSSPSPLAQDRSRRRSRELRMLGGGVIV